MTENLDKKRHLALVLIIILIGLALVTVWSKEPESKSTEVIPPTATTIKPSATAQPTKTATPTATPLPTSIPTQLPPTITFTPTPIPEPTVALHLHGQLKLETEMIEGLIHEINIKLSEQITVQVREEENGAIFLEGEPPWVDVSGIISSTGVVIATGVGDVAGYPDVTVMVTGTLENDYFTGHLAMGTEHELPGGEAGVYVIEGTYEAHLLLPTPTPSLVIDVGKPVTITFETFISDFNFAMQNGGTAWLYDHLHPAVFHRYDPEACQMYLDRTVQPEFEIVVKGLNGPEVWSWEVDGVVIQIDNAYTTDSELTIKGNVQQTDVHFAIVNGQFTWFTTCVNPEE